MTANLTKEEQKTYDKCLGQCTACLLNDVCGLQKKIKDGEGELRKLESIRDELKKEGVVLEANLSSKPKEQLQEFLKWWGKVRDVLSCVSLENRMRSQAGWKGALGWIQKLIADGYSTDEIKNLIRKELRGK